MERSGHAELHVKMVREAGATVEQQSQGRALSPLWLPVPRGLVCCEHAHPAGDGHGHHDSNLPPLLLQGRGQIQAQQRGTEAAPAARAHGVPLVPKGSPVG